MSRSELDCTATVTACEKRPRNHVYSPQTQIDKD